MTGHFPTPWAVGECGRSYKEAEGVAQVAVLPLRTGVPYEAARLRLADLCKPL